MLRGGVAFLPISVSKKGKALSPADEVSFYPYLSQSPVEEPPLPITGEREREEMGRGESVARVG